LADKLDSITGPNSPVKPYDKKQIEAVFELHAKTQEKLAELEEKFTEAIANERSWAAVKEKIDEIDSALKTEFKGEGLKIDGSKAKRMRERVKGADALLRNKAFFVQTWWGNYTINSIRKQLNAPEGTTAQDLILMADKVANQK